MLLLCSLAIIATLDLLPNVDAEPDPSPGWLSDLFKSPFDVDATAGGRPSRGTGGTVSSNKLIHIMIMKCIVLT